MKKDDTGIMNVFSDNLIELRKERRIKQEKLAEMADLSTTIISDYENRKKTPSIASAKKIADALGVTLDELCGSDIENQFKRKLDNEAVLTVLSALKILQAQVRVDKSIELILDPKKDTADYSTSIILDFFKEYEIIQNFADSNATEDMVESLIDNLKEKFKDLPALPTYKNE